MTTTLNNDSNVNNNFKALLERLEAFQEKQLFFLGGIIKSGTTWIERLLDAHPEIACKGEAHFPSLLEPSLRSGIAQYNAVIPKKGNWARLQKEGVQDILPMEYGFVHHDLDDILALSIQLLMCKWFDVESIKAVGEKTPNNAQHFQQLLRLFPKAKFIYVVRDIRDVIVSGWFFNITLDPKGALEHFGDMHQYGVHMAKIWVEDIARGMKFIEQNNKQALMIKYEELWHKPQDITRRLLQFVNVTDTDDLINTCLHYTNFSRLSGGRERGSENRASFYRKGVIGDWRNHLDNDTLVEIEMHCGALMDRLGYSRDSIESSN